MKRCPKCHEYNEKESINCKKCQYEFKGKKKIKNTDINYTTDDDDKWPSDEWKDWNTM